MTDMAPLALADIFGTQTGTLIAVLIVLWTLPWKGVALWKAARLYHRGWFIALLVLNTLAILEIIYIFFIARKKEREIAQNDEMNNE